MKRYFFRPILLFAGLYLSGVYSPAPLTAAPTIWDGPDFTFTKAPNADPTLAANQDRMTANVWITRASTRGLYNARTESSYVNSFSPEDTEWSYGVLANFASLTYQPWEDVYGGSAGHGPPATINSNMVVHLKSEDIYLSIKLLSWGQGINVRRRLLICPFHSRICAAHTGRSPTERAGLARRWVRSILVHQPPWTHFYNSKRHQHCIALQQLDGPGDGGQYHTGTVSIHGCRRRYQLPREVLPSPMALVRQPFIGIGLTRPFALTTIQTMKLIPLGALLAVFVLMQSSTLQAGSVHNVTVKDIEGKEASLESYKGKVVLIVNVASKCGLTPQYKGLETLYQKYKDKGFAVLAFPCNQFGGRNRARMRKSSNSAPLNTT